MGQDSDWDDLLGTGSIMKKVLVKGQRQGEDLDMEAPRKFFALIDIETRCNKKLCRTECYKNFLISSDADLFPGAHLVIPLMDVGERSLYRFSSKFGYGAEGNLPDIPPDSDLECVITLKLRSQYDDFLEQLSPEERVSLARRKKERGSFWFGRSNFENAIRIYESMTDLCLLK